MGKEGHSTVTCSQSTVDECSYDKGSVTQDTVSMEAWAFNIKDSRDVARENLHEKPVLKSGSQEIAETKTVRFDIDVPKSQQVPATSTLVDADTAS